MQSEMKLANEPPDCQSEESIDQCIERRLGLSPCTWRKLRTRILLISKKQQIIINQINEKRTSIGFMDNQDHGRAILQSDEKTASNSRKLSRRHVEAGTFRTQGAMVGHSHHSKHGKGATQHEHDIMELLYIGKKNVTRGKGRSDAVRIFLIRKKNQLDLLFSNGLYFWLETVPNSKVDSPLYITATKVSADKKIMVMYFNQKGKDQSNQQVRTFRQNCSKKYVTYEDQLLKNIKMPYNIQLHNSKLLELKFNLASKSSMRSNFKQFIDVEVTNGQTMNISMPKQVFTREILSQGLNPLDRAMLSENGRLIFSGKIVI